MLMARLRVGYTVYLFQWNGILKGYIDRYGMPVLHTPIKPIIGIDGEDIKSRRY